MKPLMVCIVVLFLLAALFKIEFFFTMFYLVVGVFVVLRVWSDQTMNKLVLKRSFYERAFIGDTIAVEVTIQNLSRLPIPWMMINEWNHWHLATRSSLKQVISLKGRETRRFTYTLQAEKRGYHQIGPADIHSGDLLGIRKDAKRLVVDFLTVYPKILPLVELGLPMFSPQTILPVSLPIFEDPSRITGIRDYRWGDNPRYMHWPATARTGNMMVKQFRPAIARETVIFLNLNRSDYSHQRREAALELAISLAASLAYHILAVDNLPLGFDTRGQDPVLKTTRRFSFPTGKAKDRLMQILEVLARIQPVDGGDFLGNLRRQAVRQSWGTTVAVITGQTDQALAETLLWLKTGGFHPVLMLMDQYLASDQVLSRSFPVFQMRQEKDIETWGQRQ